MTLFVQSGFTKRFSLRPRSVLFALIFMLNLPPYFGLAHAAQTRKIPVSRDLWISSVQGEDEGNNGAAPRLKLKGYQEFSLLDFDLSELKGRSIEKATLHVKLSGEETLKRVGISTLCVPWVEGTGTSYDEEPGSSSFRWSQFRSRPWTKPGSENRRYSDICDAMFGQGGSFWSSSEASEPVESWQAIEIDPRIVAARVTGISEGFVLFDDTGTELIRHGDDLEEVQIRLFPNRFFYSREQNTASAPYLQLTLSEEEDVTKKPAKPHSLTLETDDLPPGEAVFTWSMPPMDERDYIGFFAELDGKSLPQFMLPAPRLDRKNLSQEHRLHLRDLDIPPGHEATLSLRSVDSRGNESEISKTVFRTSAAKPYAFPAASKLEQAVPVKPVTLGPFDVSILDEVDKVTEKGALIPERNENYWRQNHLWNAASREVRLYGAKNEFIAFQVYFRGATENVKFTFRWDPEAKKPLPQASFHNFEYVDSAEGKIADPLLPMTENEIRINNHGSVFCEMLIPETYPDGTLRGSLILETKNETLTLSVVLTVWDFTLPNTLGFLPEMNCYSLPENERDYYRLAQLHRTYINRVPYSHRGTVSQGCAPRWDEQRREFLWNDWDKRYSPYFDGSAFADLPRGPVPVEAFYLPLFENFPADIFKHYSRAKNDGDIWAEETLSKEYVDTFQKAARDFAEHLIERQYDRTCFHFFLNNKSDYKRAGWSRASSPWLLDEPASFRDFAALEFFGRIFKDATQDLDHPVRYRCDISRPQWQRDVLDETLEVNVMGGDVFRNYHRMVLERKELFGQFLYTYGTTCKPEHGALQPVAWSWDAWTLGADGIVPWQTIGNADSWNKSDELSLFYPGRTKNESVVPSQRLKAYRRGQQDVEYLIALQKVTKRPRWDIAQAVRREWILEPKNRKSSGEDAGTLQYDGLTPEKLFEMRKKVAQAILAEKIFSHERHGGRGESFGPTTVFGKSSAE